MSVLTEDGEYWVVVHNTSYGWDDDPPGDTGDWDVDTGRVHGDTAIEDSGEDSGIVIEPGDCKGTVSYKIGVDATWTTGLTLRTDDISQYGDGSLTVEGTAHLPKGTP